jgi:hypothetical protein
VRIPQLKHQPYRMNRVNDALKNHDGIWRIEHNKSTGSVVIHYDPDVLDEERILNILSYNNLFDASLVVSDSNRDHRPGEKAGKAVGRMVFSWAVGRVLDANGLSFLAALV